MNEISEIDIDMCLNFDLLPGSRCFKHMVVCSQETHFLSLKWRTFAYGTYMTYFNLNTNKHTKKPSYAVTNDTWSVGNGNLLRCAARLPAACLLNKDNSSFIFILLLYKFYFKLYKIKKRIRKQNIKIMIWHQYIIPCSFSITNFFSL